MNKDINLLEARIILVKAITKDGKDWLPFLKREIKKWDCTPHYFISLLFDAWTLTHAEMMLKNERFVANNELRFKYNFKTEEGSMRGGFSETDLNKFNFTIQNLKRYFEKTMNIEIILN